VITRALGTKAEALPEVKEMNSKKGDLYLLCSDGLNSMVPDDEIKAILISGKTLEEMGKTLVEKANQNGGEDNISLILLRILS